MSAARHLRPAPEPAEILAAEIDDICAQIDRRTGKPPGTALRGCYFWHWPPGGHDADVLARLHAEAVAMLTDLCTDTAESLPSDPPPHPTKGNP